MNLYDPLHVQINRYCRALVRDTEEAKDLLSETVAVGFESFEKIRDTSKFKFYLFGIASNLFKKKLRRKKFFGVFDLKKESNKPDSGIDPSVSADIVLLYEAIEKLTLPQREIIVLFEISGFPLKDIAEMKSMNLSTVKTHLSRGRSRLEELLNPQGLKTEIKNIENEFGIVTETKTTIKSL